MYTREKFYEVLLNRQLVQAKLFIKDPNDLTVGIMIIQMFMYLISY